MSTKNKNENEPMPALMRKTKAQLVDIILRKDNIERGLRNDIKGMENSFNECKEQLSEANRQIELKNIAYNTLNSNFESVCDENASTICELKETIKHNRSTIFKLYIGFIVSFIIMLCLIAYKGL